MRTGATVGRTRRIGLLITCQERCDQLEGANQGQGTVDQNLVEVNVLRMFTRRLNVLLTVSRNVCGALELVLW